MNSEHDAAKVRFFPPGIPLIAVILGIVFERLWPIDFGVIAPAPFRYGVGGLIVLLSIGVLGAWPVYLFRSGGQSENPWKPTTHLESRGPYRFTRNPMYLQMILVCIGIAVIAGSWWLLIFTVFARVALRRLVIDPEEAYLEKKFGETYHAYRRRVRRWL